MPLFKTITANHNTEIFIWKITESYDQLVEEVQLNELNTVRLNGMRSQQHRLGFLSVRKLLQQNGYTDFDLNYDEFGKPHLKDGKHISITHSHEFSAIAISDINIGIDIEKKREKISVVADKFADYEFKYLDNKDHDDYISKLTVIWGIKEAIFKVRNEPGISFKDHIKVQPFAMESTKADALLEFGNAIHKFPAFFNTIENFILVYTFEN
jgi:phosphopantetheinyl transferase